MGKRMTVLACCFRLYYRLSSLAKVSDGHDGFIGIADTTFFSVVLLFWVRSEIMDEL